MGKVTPEDIEAIVQLFDASDWNELRVTADGIDIYLSKDGTGQRVVSTAGVPVTPTGSGVGREEHLPPPPAPSRYEQSIPAGMLAIRAPNLGTFFKSPKPGAPPFVDIGHRVEPGTDVCVIEVMKLFTVVTAGMSGVVRGILVSDGEMVEFDQPLMLIEPTA